MAIPVKPKPAAPAKPRPAATQPRVPLTWEDEKLPLPTPAGKEGDNPFKFT